MFQEGETVVGSDDATKLPDIGMLCFYFKSSSCLLSIGSIVKWQQCIYSLVAETSVVCLIFWCSFQVFSML